MRTFGSQCSRLFGGFLLAGTRDGGDSSMKQQNPSHINNLIPNSSNPLYINVQVNSTRHAAIVDTGSAVTIIINKQLLKELNHKGFIPKRSFHQSANDISIDIIGEIQLEIKIQTHSTFITADVAANLVAGLLLGNDWITNNNVIINTPQRQVLLTDGNYRVVAQTAFLRPPGEHLPVLLTQEITLAPHSEQCVNISIASTSDNTNNALFEPTTQLQPKQILLPHAVLHIDKNKSQIVILNANDR